MPAPDELDRDRFYAPDADDDGEEYELEGPDPEVIAAEERRAAEVVAATKRSIDIDEIYREADRDHSSEILNDWVENFRFRFQVKHMLIATGVLAIMLTLWRLDVLGTAIVLLVMFSVIGLYLYLQWKEKQHQDEVAARRREMYDERRTAQINPGAASVDPLVAAADPAPLPPNDVDQSWQDAMHEDEFRFRFSLKQLMVVMVVSAVVLGMVNILGGPQNAASLLGFVALAGLIFHALGYEPPGIVALGWWLLLVMYVMLSIFGVVWSMTR